MAASELEAMTEAVTKAKLREIFQIADQDRNSFIDADELLWSFTTQKCHDLFDRMGMSCDAKVSPEEFVEVVQKAMEGRSGPARQNAMKAMRAAAEGVARKAEAEAVRREANAEAARREAEGRTAAAGRALLEVQQRCDRLLAAIVPASTPEWFLNMRCLPDTPDPCIASPLEH